MLKVNYQSMFDSLLPRVTVTRATVEDTGNFVGETNPHIDFEGEAVPGGSLIKVGDNLKFSNSAFGSKQLRISLDLNVSDTTSTDICFSWLSNFDLKKYLNNYIFPVFNPSIVKIGKKEFFLKNLGAFLEPYLALRPDRNFIKIPMSQIGKSFSQYSRGDLQDSQLAAAFSQTINSANPETDPDGNTIYNFSFNAVHNCMDYPNPNYLSYYLLTALDMDAVATDYPELQSMKKSKYEIHPSFISPITVFNVFEDNDIVRAKTIFLDPKGEVWTGDVHKFKTASSLNADDTETAFMSGLAGATDSVPLSRRTVKSYNIIDNRTLGYVMPNQINFSILHNSIDQRIAAMSKTIFKDINKGKTAEHSYISNVFLSSDVSLLGFIGIIIVCIGLFLISYSKNLSFNFRGFALAISTAILITAYTLIDGMGVRKSANGFSYIFWLIALNGVPILLISIFSKNGFRKKNTFSIKSGIAAGLFATLSYSIVVWSMQYIEIAYVSSIREVSIVFATIIGMLYLYEKNAIKRIMPSVLIVTGITLVYFQIL